jgi:hypothetical protein
MEQEIAFFYPAPLTEGQVIKDPPDPDPDPQHWSNSGFSMHPTTSKYLL